MRKAIVIVRATGAPARWAAVAFWPTAIKARPYDVLLITAPATAISVTARIRIDGTPSNLELEMSRRRELTVNVSSSRLAISDALSRTYPTAKVAIIAGMRSFRIRK